MRKLLYLSLSFLSLVFVCCKKNNNGNESTDFDKVRDSVFFYAKETYLWSDALPSYETFQPRNFSGGTDIAALQAEVDAISQYKINPNTNLPYEYYPAAPGTSKYSFIDGGQTNTSLGGSRADFGMAVTAVSNTDLRIRYVYAGAAAANAGMRRGEQIIKINGRTGLDISINNDYNFVVNAISTSPVNFTLKRTDGTTYDVSLTSTNYTVNPVITYKVFNTTNTSNGAAKVGYIVFNSFTTLSNAKPKLDEAFNYFTAQGITDLVVDLRYNGGGYGSTAEYLSNLIVPPGKTNTEMYKVAYNPLMTSNKATILKNQWRRDQNNQPYNLYDNIDYSLAANTQNFVKAGSLNISRVFFLVTGATASSSEIVINNLKPHLDVKLIGRTTLGKPVGFFDIRIGKYFLYIVQSETRNSVNQGGYYSGMAPGSADYQGVNDADDITRDFGDQNEKLLAHALNYVRTGNYNVNTKTEAVGAQVSAQVALGKKEFEGMIFDKPLNRKNR